MKNAKKIVWGIVLALVGIAILLFAFFPEYGPVGVPMWKWVAAVLLIWWLLDRLLFGWGIKERLDIFLPLGLLFILFEKHIAPLIGREEDFVNNWMILGAALLLTLAVKLIFSKKIRWGSENNALSESLLYLDAGEKKRRWVKNKMGEMNVYYQNTDVGDQNQPVILNVSNKLGAVVVHIPSGWTVTVKAKNRLGSILVRESPAVGREFILEGSNTLGEISVVSP